MVKFILIIFIIGCSKIDQYKCKKYLLPVDRAIEGKFLYFSVKAGGDAVSPFTANVYYSDKSNYLVIKDTLDISGHIERVPVGGNIYVHFDLYCADGSYRVEKDTIVKR